MMALEAFFKEKGVPNPLTHGESWKLDGEEVITYQLVRMVEPGNTSAARIQGGCNIQPACASGSADTPPPKAVWRGDTHRKVPYIMHATSCDAALQILCDGHIKTNPGAYGTGIYGYAAEDDSQTSIGKLWDRGRFYNGGASFLLQTQGVVCVKSNQHEVIPEGVMGCHGSGANTQYVAGPRTVRYHSVTLAVQGLLELLDRQLARTGYGTELHAALQKVASFMEGGAASSNKRAVPGDSVQLLNRIVAQRLPGQNRGERKSRRGPGRERSGSPSGRSGSPTEAGDAPSPTRTVSYPQPYPQHHQPYPQPYAQHPQPPPAGWAQSPGAWGPAASSASHAWGPYTDAQRVAMEASAAVLAAARQHYATAGGMFQGQWRYVDGGWRPASPQLNAQEANQQLKFHGGDFLLLGFAGVVLFDVFFIFPGWSSGLPLRCARAGPGWYSGLPL